MAGGDREEEEDSIVSVIARRNLDPAVHGDTQERVSQALLSLRTVRLDREGMTALKNLEMVKEVQSLYLQENQIKKIENLDVLKNLRFLSLSWNRVEEIQNLRCLTNLQFLDISHNLIKKLDACELPQSLLIMDLTGNPCTKTKDYRQLVLEALPLLQKLDGEKARDCSNENPLSDVEEEEDGSDSDDSDETCLPSDVSGGLSSVSQEIIQRSYQRRHRALREHEERLSELNDTPDKQPLILPINDTDNAVPQECSSTCLQQVTSCTTKPQNSIISEQKHQNSALVKKQLRDQRNNATCMPASRAVTKHQVSASPCLSGAGRSGVALNRTPSKTLPPSAPKIGTASKGKPPAKVTAFQKERQVISAPSTRQVHAVPTKNASQVAVKTPARQNPTTTRAQNERQVTSAPTKKTLQSKLPMTQLKVASGTQAPRKKTL